MNNFTKGHILLNPGGDWSAIVPKLPWASLPPHPRCHHLLKQYELQECACINQIAACDMCATETVLIFTWRSVLVIQLMIPSILWYRCRSTGMQNKTTVTAAKCALHMFARQLGSTCLFICIPFLQFSVFDVYAVSRCRPPTVVPSENNLIGENIKNCECRYMTLPWLNFHVATWSGHAAQLGKAMQRSWRMQRWMLNAARTMQRRSMQRGPCSAGHGAGHAARAMVRAMQSGSCNADPCNAEACSAGLAACGLVVASRWPVLHCRSKRKLNGLNREFQTCMDRMVWHFPGIPVGWIRREAKQ